MQPESRSAALNGHAGFGQSTTRFLMRHRGFQFQLRRRGCDVDELCREAATNCDQTSSDPFVVEGSETNEQTKFCGIDSKMTQLDWFQFLLLSDEYFFQISAPCKALTQF